MKKLVYRALNTRPGRAVRRGIDSWIRAHPKERRIGSVTVVYASATDIDVNRKAVTDGLGYDCDWLADGPLSVVCDLGCNTGLFPLWIKNRIGVSPTGLAVDANPDMCERARRHFLLNNIHMTVLQGFAGEADMTPLRRHSITVSSAAVSDPRQYGEAVDVVYPPAINLSAVWNGSGLGRGDLLKVDIEGSELGLFMLEYPFVCQFKRLAVEWHEPMCDLATIRLLLNRDFRLDKYQFHGRGGIGYGYFKNRHD